MMVGIGLGIMLILCAVGLIAGGGFFMHHELKDKRDQPAIERSDHYGKTAEPSWARPLEEKKNTLAAKQNGEEAK